MRCNTKILAIGSPFGEDRLGWEIAKALVNVLPESVSVEVLDRPGMNLLSHFDDKTVILLIDAIRSDIQPGTIHWLSGEDIPKASQHTSSHGIGIKEAFQLGKTLNILPRQLHVCGIEMDPDWLDSETLSPSTLEAMPILVNQIQSFIEKTLSPNL